MDQNPHLEGLTGQVILAAQQQMSDLPGDAPDEGIGQRIAEGGATKGGGHHAAGEEIGDDESHDEMHADERRPRDEDTRSDAGGNRMRRSAQAQDAHCQVTDRAKETLARP